MGAPPGDITTSVVWKSSGAPKQMRAPSGNNRYVNFPSSVLDVCS